MLPSVRLRQVSIYTFELALTQTYNNDLELLSLQTVRYNRTKIACWACLFSHAGHLPAHGPSSKQSQTLHRGSRNIHKFFKIYTGYGFVVDKLQCKSSVPRYLWNSRLPSQNPPTEQLLWRQKAEKPDESSKVLSSGFLSHTACSSNSRPRYHHNIGTRCATEGPKTVTRRSTKVGL